jgi:hypothetical protein
MLRNNQSHPNKYIEFVNDIGRIKIDDLRAACDKNNLDRVFNTLNVAEKNKNKLFLQSYIYENFKLNYAVFKNQNIHNLITRANKIRGNKELTIDSLCCELTKNNQPLEKVDKGSGSKRVLETARGSGRELQVQQKKRHRNATSLVISPLPLPEECITLSPDKLDHTSPFLPPFFLTPLMPVSSSPVASIVQPPTNNNLNIPLQLSPQTETESGKITENNDPFSWLPQQANTGHHNDHAARLTSSITTTTPINCGVGIFNTSSTPRSTQDESNKTELNDPSIKSLLK